MYATEGKVRARTLFYLVMLATAAGAAAQHGTAPPGYYPIGYAADTWTGEVTATNDTTREITLTYTKGQKVETFTGVLEEGYKVKMKDGSMHELRPSEIPNGSRIQVLYMKKTRKAGDKKMDYSSIFQIKFLPHEPQKK